MERGELLNPSLVAELRRVEIRTRRSIDTDLMGKYRSAFRGTGLIFSDLREYQPGDDVRHIHWKVTARTGKPYIKTFDEDRQLNVIIAVDISNSTNTGAPRTRHRKALEFAALVSMLGNRNQDAVGLCLFSDTVEDFFPVKRNRTQFQQIIAALLRQRALTPRTSIKAALNFLLKHQRKRAVIFVLSDFFCDSFEEELRRLAFRNDVIGVLLADTHEESVPQAGIVQFLDAESGEHLLIDTSSRRARAALERIMLERRHKIAASFQSAGGDFIEIRDNVLRPLADLMKQRTKRH